MLRPSGGEQQAPAVPQALPKPPLQGLLKIGMTASIDDVNYVVNQVTQAHQQKFGYTPPPGLVFDVMRAWTQKQLHDIQGLFDIPTSPLEGKVRQIGSQATDPNLPTGMTPQQERGYQYAKDAAAAIGVNLEDTHPQQTYATGKLPKPAELGLSPTLGNWGVVGAGLDNFLQSLPGLAVGVYALGKAGVLDFRDVNRRYLLKPVGMDTGQDNGRTKINRVATIASKFPAAIEQDFTHAENWPFAIMDVWGLLTLGASTAARVSAAGARAAELGDVGAATKISEAAKTFARPPMHPGFEVGYGAFTENVPAFENAALRLAQRWVLDRANKKLLENATSPEYIDQWLPPANKLQKMYDALFSPENFLHRQRVNRTAIEYAVLMGPVYEMARLDTFGQRARSVMETVRQNPELDQSWRSLKREHQIAIDKVIQLVMTDSPDPVTAWKNYHARTIQDIQKAKEDFLAQTPEKAKALRDRFDFHVQTARDLRNQVEDLKKANQTDVPVSELEMRYDVPHTPSLSRKARDIVTNGMNQRVRVALNEDGSYTILGEEAHGLVAAAKMAGLDDVPVQIVRRAGGQALDQMKIQISELEKNAERHRAAAKKIGPEMRKAEKVTKRSDFSKRQTLNEYDYAVASHEDQLAAIDAAVRLLEGPTKLTREFVDRAYEISKAQEVLKQILFGLDPEIGQQHLAEIAAILNGEKVVPLLNDAGEETGRLGRVIPGEVPDAELKKAARAAGVALNRERHKLETLEFRRRRPSRSGKPAGERPAVLKKIAEQQKRIAAAEQRLAKAQSDLSTKGSKVEPLLSPAAAEASNAFHEEIASMTPSGLRAVAEIQSENIGKRTSELEKRKEQNGKAAALPPRAGQSDITGAIEELRAGRGPAYFGRLEPETRKARRGKFGFRKQPSKYGYAPPAEATTAMFRMDGKALQMGNFRRDTSQVLIEDYKDVAQALIAYAHYQDLWDIAVKDAISPYHRPIRDIRRIPPSLRRYVQALENKTITPQAAQTIKEADKQALLDWLYPADGTYKIDDPHARFVDERLIMERFGGENIEFWRNVDRLMSGVMSPINEPWRFLTIFATPAYLLNAGGAAVTLAVEEGFAAPRYWGKALHADKIWSPEVKRALDRLAGSTHASALVTERNKITTGSRWLQTFWQAVTDQSFRRAAVIAELEKRGLINDAMSANEVLDVLNSAIHPLLNKMGGGGKVVEVNGRKIEPVPGVHIGPIGTGDAWKETLDEAKAATWKPGDRYWYDAIVNDVAHGPVLVARDNEGKLVGVLSYSDHGDSVLAHNLQTVEGSKGAGRALLRALAEREAGKHINFQSSHAAESFYKRVGFEPVGEASGGYFSGKARTYEILNPEQGKQVIEAAQVGRKKMLDFDKGSWPERAILRHLFFVYAFLRAGTIWSLRYLGEHPLQYDVLHHAGPDREKQIQQMVGNVPEWFTRTGYVPFAPNTVWNPMQFNMPAVLSQVAYPLSSMFTDMPYASIQDLLGPVPTLGGDLVRGTTDSGQALPSANVPFGKGRVAGSILDLLEQSPIGYGIQRGAKAAKQKKKIPAPAVSLPEYNPLSAVSKRQNAFLNLSSFEIDGFWNNWGRVLFRTADPIHTNRAALEARYWRDVKQNDPEAFVKHQLDLAMEVADRSATVLGMKQAPADVKNALALVAGRETFIEKWKQEHPNFQPGDHQLAVLTVDYLKQEGLIDDSKAKQYRGWISKAPNTPAWRGLWIKFLHDNGAKPWMDWMQEVNRVNYFNTDAFTANLKGLKSAGIGDWVKSAGAKNDIKWEFGRQYEAYIQKRQQLQAQMGAAVNQYDRGLYREQIRNLDNIHSQPVMVNGVGFPSFRAVQFGRLSPDQQKLYLARKVAGSWGQLDAFDRELLTGQKPNPQMFEGYQTLSSWLQQVGDKLAVGQHLSSKTKPYYEQILIDRAKKAGFKQAAASFEKDLAFSKLPLSDRMMKLDPIRTSPYVAQWDYLLQGAHDYAQMWVNAGWVTSSGNPRYSDIADGWQRYAVPNVEAWIAKQSPGFQKEVQLYMKARTHFLRDLVKP